MWNMCSDLRPGFGRMGAQAHPPPTPLTPGVWASLDSPGSYTPVVLSSTKLERLRGRFGDIMLPLDTIPPAVMAPSAAKKRSSPLWGPPDSSPPPAGADSAAAEAPPVITPLNLARMLAHHAVTAAAPLAAPAAAAAASGSTWSSSSSSSSSSSVISSKAVLPKGAFPTISPLPGASKPLADAALHPTLLKRLEPQHRLGSGGYGVVVSVCDKASGEMLVVKKISDAFICAADAQRCFREVAFQKVADHPNILPLLAVSVSSTDLYLLCPPMAMDLQGALRHNLLPHARQKRCVLYQLSCALAYMHASGALHRDLKPANVLLDLDGHLRLCDFGLCRSTPHATPDAAALATPRAPLDASSAAEEGVDGSQSVSVGSRWYRAPEVLLGASVYGASADMWSFGCIVAEVLSGKTLLLGSSSHGQLAKILEVTGGRPEPAELAADLNLPEERARAALAALPTALAPMRLSKLLPRVPTEGIDLVSSLLRRRPSERASFDAVLRHSYLVPFITEDEGPRLAYAAASVGTADRFIAPLDDRRQFAPRTYHEYFEQHLAETLEAYHEAPPPAAASSEADMGC